MPSAEAIRIAKQAAAEMGFSNFGEASVTPLDNWQSPNGPEDYGLSADGASEGEAADEADTERAPRSETASKTEKPKRDLPWAWWRDPATIPPRSSLYEGHYIRRTIGATIGGGGRAKTTRGIYEGISMAVGFDIATKEKLPAGELRVWICNGEEDQDELDRRVAAACQRYGISQADLGGRLFVQSVRDNPLRIATLVNNRPVIDQAVEKYMADFISDSGIDVFMIDPLVSFHGVMENDNSHMDLVIKEGFGAIANRTNSAGELFHHPGKAKPGQADTTVEDGLGDPVGGALRQGVQLHDAGGSREARAVGRRAPAARPDQQRKGQYGPARQGEMDKACG
jgi:RecA-family ATPase